jgi:hypothetical protein
VSPKGTEGVVGVTAIDANVGAATVITVLPLTDPSVAVIVTVPCAPPDVDANPVPLLMVADPVPFVRLHVELLVTSAVLLSV